MSSPMHKLNVDFDDISIELNLDSYDHRLKTVYLTTLDGPTFAFNIKVNKPCSEKRLRKLWNTHPQLKKMGRASNVVDSSVYRYPIMDRNFDLNGLNLTTYTSKPNSTSRVGVAFAPR